MLPGLSGKGASISLGRAEDSAPWREHDVYEPLDKQPARRHPYRALYLHTSYM